jgi:hypothetical protein
VHRLFAEPTVFAEAFTDARPNRPREIDVRVFWFEIGEKDAG